MKKIKYLIYFSLLLHASCSVKGNFRGLFSYYEKTIKDNPDLIIKSQQSICNAEITSHPHILIANGLELKKCIYLSKESLIYIWSPNCTSGNCYSLNYIQKMCDKKNIDLFIVAEYYDLKKMSFDYNLKRSIIGIDTKYYKTNFTSKYITRFIYDLTSKYNIHNKFLYFKDGALLNTFNLLESMNY